jgi:hypothetical protein
MNEKLQALAQALREGLAKIPKPLRQEEVSRQVIIGLLTRAVAEMGLIAVPAWKPPRSTRDRIDLVGVEPGSDPPRVLMAFAVQPLVELTQVRSLEWVDCPDKVFVTFSERADKVKQSTFFLSPGYLHLNLYG